MFFHFFNASTCPELKFRKHSLSAAFLFFGALGVIALTNTPSPKKGREEEGFLFSRSLTFGDKGGGTASGDKCFQTTSELYEAVDKFVEGGNTAELSATYGLPMGTWCVSGIQDFSWLFTGLNGRTIDSLGGKGEPDLHPTRGSFDEDISAWDVSSATDMTFMFGFAETFNQDLSTWSTSKVKNMFAMFADTLSFNGDLSLWNVAKVSTMGSMFFNATSFDRDLKLWDTSNVEVMIYMFYGASSFNKDLSAWNVTKVSGMEGMFNQAGSFNQNLCAWGEKLATNVDVRIMFPNTACARQEDPNLNVTDPPLGPFCQVCN
jgi:surface protein